MTIGIDGETSGAGSVSDSRNVPELALVLSPELSKFSPPNEPVPPASAAFARRNPPQPVP